MAEYKLINLDFHEKNPPRVSTNDFHIASDLRSAFYQKNVFPKPTKHIPGKPVAVNFQQLYP